MIQMRMTAYSHAVIKHGEAISAGLRDCRRRSGRSGDCDDENACGICERWNEEV
jgi:hypothetical protein